MHEWGTRMLLKHVIATRPGWNGDILGRGSGRSAPAAHPRTWSTPTADVRAARQGTLMSVRNFRLPLTAFVNTEANPQSSPKGAKFEVRGLSEEVTSRCGRRVCGFGDGCRRGVDPLPWTHRE